MHQQDSSEKGNSIWLDPDLSKNLLLLCKNLCLKLPDLINRYYFFLIYH